METITKRAACKILDIGYASFYNLKRRGHLRDTEKRGIFFLDDILRYKENRKNRTNIISPERKNEIWLDELNREMPKHVEGFFKCSKCKNLVPKVYQYQICKRCLVSKFHVLRSLINSVCKFREAV